MENLLKLVVKIFPHKKRAKFAQCLPNVLQYLLNFIQQRRPIASW